MDDQKPTSPDKNSQNTSNELLEQPYNETQTETYVSPSGEPATIAPLPTPLSLQKPKSHAGRWFLRGFVLLIIAALAAFGYWQWTEAQSANNERASIQSELETVKAAIKTDENAEEPEPVVLAKTDKELVTTESEALLAALEGSKLIVLETEIEGKFARVKAGSSTPGTDGLTILLEKANENWVVLLTAGSGDLTIEARKILTDQYGVPAEFLE